MTAKEEDLDQTIITEISKYFGMAKKGNQNILNNASKVLFYDIFNWMKKIDVEPIDKKRAQEILESTIEKRLTEQLPLNS